MATLSAAQLLDIRRIVGDIDSAGNARWITENDEVQTFHDDVDADFPKTYVAYLRRLVGMTLPLVSVSDTFGRQEEQGELHQHYKDQLAHWELLAGLGSGIGSTTTRTYRADSKQTTEPDFSEGR